MSIIDNLVYKVFDKCQKIWQRKKYQHYYKNYQLPKSFRFNGPAILIYGKGKFYSGPDTYIGSYSTFQIVKDYFIKIGKGCKISHNVRVYTSSYSADADFSNESIPLKKGNVIIGDYTWIGANVFIMPGITIGQNVVIGANSVVTKDIESNSIVGGIPARKIRDKRDVGNEF